MSDQRKMSASEACLVLANYATLEVGRTVRYRRVQSRMLVWCRGGEGRIVANGRTYPMAAGRFLVLPWAHAIAYHPGPQRALALGGVHVIPRLPSGSPLDYGVQHHPGPESERQAAWRLDLPLPGLEQVLAGELAAAPALQHLAEYCVLWYRREQRTEAQARLLGQAMIAEWQHLAARGQATAGDLPAPLRRILAHIAEPPPAPPTMAELAAVGFCSLATMGRLFRRHLGCTPLAYVQRVQLDRAARLLATTDLPVNAVGRQVGIDDPYYFSKLFRKVRGETATAYRRRAALLSRG